MIRTECILVFEHPLDEDKEVDDIGSQLRAGFGGQFKGDVIFGRVKVTYNMKPVNCGNRDI
jgi:hypothetical protein